MASTGGPTTPSAASTGGPTTPTAASTGAPTTPSAASTGAPTTPSAASPADRTRDAAKWLIAAFGAVGAALAAGVQISNLGAASTGRVALAVGFGALGVLGVILAIYHIGKVLQLQWATTSDLRQSSSLVHLLKREPAFFGGFGHVTVDAMIDDYDRLLTEFRNAQRASWAAGNAVPTATVAVREAEFDAISDIVQFWRNLVIYDKTRVAYDSAQKWLLIGALLAFVGLVGFAYEANPPAKPAGPSTVINQDQRLNGIRGLRGIRGARGVPGPQGPSGKTVTVCSPQCNGSG